MSSPIYLNIQKILPLTVNLMMVITKYCIGFPCPLKNSIYWKFFYRGRNLTSDDKSDVSERDSHASKARSNRGKETEKLHFAGGKPALIGRGEKPNQIGSITVSTKQGYSFRLSSKAACPADTDTFVPKGVSA